MARIHELVSYEWANLYVGAGSAVVYHVTGSCWNTYNTRILNIRILVTFLNFGLNLIITHIANCLAFGPLSVVM
jgi:hypothetical protein